jgi:hypothetical protein
VLQAGGFAPAATRVNGNGDIMRIDIIPGMDTFGIKSLKRLGSRRTGLALAGAVAATMALAASSYAQQPGPFEDLGGAWSGTGVVNLREGSKERVHCKANYTVKDSGFTIDQQLTCASDAYKFEMTSNIVQQGGQLTGIWFESVHRVAGKVVGQANGSQIKVRAEGDTFTALLDVTTHGDKQELVMESPGSKVESVTIALNRAK